MICWLVFEVAVELISRDYDLRTGSLWGSCNDTESLNFIRYMSFAAWYKIMRLVHPI